MGRGADGSVGGQTPRTRVAARSRPRVALILAVLAATFGPGLAFAAQRLAEDAPSPALGHAQVVAHGVAPLPAASLAWRVVLDTAEVGEVATTQERALGFTLADRTAMLIDDQNGTQQRLAAGEASFVPPAAQQRRSSLGTTDASYYRLALVPAELASDGGGDRLVFAGDPFAAPQGRAFDVDLVRDVLEPGEQGEMPAGDAPTLLLVTDGTVEASVDGQLPVQLAAGQAATVTGEFLVEATGTRPATYVAAALGPEVPAPPVPATGSVTLRVFGCPAELTPDVAIAAGFAAATVAACQPVALDPAPTLILAGNQPLSPDQPDPATGTYTWTGLISGPFPLGEPALPSGYGEFVAVDAAGAVSSPPVFDVGVAPFDAAATLYLFRGDTGSLTMSFFACPVGTTLEEVAAEVCTGDVDAAALDVEVVPPAGGAPLGFDDFAGSEPTYAVDDLAFGTYRVRLNRLPVGYDQYAIRGAIFDPQAGNHSFVIDAQSPAATLNAFVLPEAGLDDGAITVRIYDCPPGMGRQDLVGDICQATAGTSLRLLLADGTVLGADEATITGNTVTWDELPDGAHQLEVFALPPGYAETYAPGVGDGGPVPTAFPLTIGAASPTLDVAVYNLQPAGPGAPPTQPAQPPPSSPPSDPGTAPVDSDGDGLGDGLEASLGTNPGVLDSDGDGRTDGDEVGPREISTDPTDADSDDDGALDGPEIAAGTDPNDPTSR